MLILLFFAFVSGVLTILAPCIWPILPVVLSSSAGGKFKPLGVTLGIVSSFTLLTLTLSYVIRIIPFDPDILRLFAVVVIGGLGLTLLIPRLSQILETAVSRLTSRFSGGANVQKQGFAGGFGVGFSLGVVWSPCAGPILATVATLAATQSLNLAAILLLVSFSVGVGVPLFVISTLGNAFLSRSRFVSKYTGVIQRAFGLILLLAALGIYTGYDRVLQAKILDLFPAYGGFIVGLEDNERVKEELDKITGITGKEKIMKSETGKLGRYGRAPQFEGISTWLNSKSLTSAELKGKVVLIDFWTYTCINCIRTLPFVTGWYEKYKDKGFVVVGVHTPEFEFEKSTDNVKKALDQYRITYPVAQDNNYRTWRAYENRYWPAHYLLDADGMVRYIHFGEGMYDETEMAIRTLIEENGFDLNEGLIGLEEKTPSRPQTPESYLGYDRMARFSSVEALRKGTNIYTLPGTLNLHYLAFGGEWDVHEENSIAKAGSVLEMKFLGNEVNLVIVPASDSDEVRVYLDGAPVTMDNSGSDVKDGKVVFRGNQLYNLIDLKGQYGEHVLRLEFVSGQTSVFAFTFG